MLIMLTHANHLYSDRKQVRKMQPYPPLQTLIAAALLRRDGHRVVFFDCTFDRDFSATMDRVPAGSGGGMRGQFQLPDQDVPARESRAGV